MKKKSRTVDSSELIRILRDLKNFHPSFSTNFWDRQRCKTFKNHIDDEWLPEWYFLYRHKCIDIKPGSTYIYSPHLEEYFVRINLTGMWLYYAMLNHKCVSS